MKVLPVVSYQAQNQNNKKQNVNFGVVPANDTIITVLKKAGFRDALTSVGDIFLTKDELNALRYSLVHSKVDLRTKNWKEERNEVAELMRMSPAKRRQAYLAEVRALSGQLFDLLETNSKKNNVSVEKVEQILQGAGSRSREETLEMLNKELSSKDPLIQKMLRDALPKAG